MTEPRSITCEDCGGSYETKRANTKRCATCRMIRDFAYINDRISECWACDAEFSPLERGERLCGSCNYKPKGYGETECGFCNEPRLRVARDVAVCHECARDPKLRKQVFKALMKKQRGRREEYAHAA